MNGDLFAEINFAFHCKCKDLPKTFQTKATTKKNTILSLKNFFIYFFIYNLLYAIKIKIKT